MTILVRSGVVAASRRFALELVRPSSVVAAGSGSSASIVGLGSVDFSAVTSLSLNGVFSAEYDNYMISLSNLSSSHTVAQGFTTRLRASGSDNSTANAYTYQLLQAASTTITGSRAADTFWFFGSVAESTGQRSGATMYLYGPNLAQPTAGRVVGANGSSGALLVDYAATHNQSTAYDGITFSLASGNFTGNVAVYGLRG